MSDCRRIKQEFGLTAECCDSCHEDEEMGYDSMCTIDTQDGPVEVCCKVQIEFNSRVAAS